MNAAFEKAIVMLTEIDRALTRGTKHYDLQGNVLETPKEILEALLRDGQIIFEPRTVPKHWDN